MYRQKMEELFEHSSEHIALSISINVIEKLIYVDEM
jgi:hypothetical protein